MPELKKNTNIQVTNYPVDPVYTLIVQLVGYVQMLVYAMLFFGEPILRVLGFTETPQWIQSIQNNKMQAVIMTFLFASFAQKLLVTGAFEIIFDDNLIFSKLETGMVPSGAQIKHMIVNVVDKNL
jgi:selT/selW/selH-like putative selenoprotein